jgi:hypothetical protein
MAKVPFNVSVFDLNHVLSKVGKSVDDLSKEELEEILFYVGMDKKGYELESVMHRPKYSPNNEPWLGGRYSGFERQDREWMFGGKSTLDNVISSQDDLEHKKDLLMMSRQANFTLEECERAEATSRKKQQ